MATWRIKGYVSDSEDEDDELDFNSFTRVNHDDLITSAEPDEVTDAGINEPSSGPSQIFNPSTSVHDERPPILGSQLLFLPSATALQKTLTDGLAIIQDVLSQPPSPPAIAQLTDDTESPLSTPPESPIIPPLETSVESYNNVTSPSQHIDILPIQRTLRQRNAVQQNPYTVDRAKYRLSLAGSGHRPIRDVDHLKPSRNVEESQESTFEGSSQPPNSFDVDPMDIELLLDSEELPPIRSAYGPGSLPSTSEELPDIEDLLNHQSPTRNLNQEGATTREADVVRNFQNVQTPRSSVQLKRKPMRLEKRSKSGVSNEQENSIPSPPRSTSTTSIELMASQGGQSRTQSPILLPTPLVSSGLRRKRPVIDDDTQSISSHDPIQTDLTESDSSEREQSESDELRVMQRRIKGVLPASWWSIGRLQQDLSKKKSHNRSAVAASRSEVGVAQRKPNPSPNRNYDQLSRSAFLEDLASEESEDETNHRPENKYHQTSLPRWTPQTSPDPPSRDDEALEIMDDDLIDPMLPNYSRPTSSRRKRQTDLCDSMLNVTAKHTKRRHSAHQDVATAPIISRAGHKRPRQKRIDRDFGILDAPDLRTKPHTDLPVFLRVAARQARQNARAAPSKASRKILSLSASEKVDANIDIQSAAFSSTHNRSGSKSDVNTKFKSPSRSQRHVPDANLMNFEKRSNDHDQVHGIDASPQQSPLVVSEGIDNEQNAKSLRLTRLRSLLPFTNRSGRGRLVSKPSIPRSAQFEEARPLPRLLPKRMPRPATKPSTLSHNSIPREVFSLNPRLESHDVKRASRRKKQTPSKSKNPQQILLIPQEPTDRQLRLAFENNDPHLRQLLHVEFNDYQTAWFQGRKLGQVCATASTQHRFDVFLEVLSAHLSIAVQDADNNYDARDLNSFLHRILPNRRGIGAQGQIGDKVFDVLEQDVLVARNVFDLYVCLLNLAPGCAPRPRVLEMMVNFTQAHHEICNIAVSAWEAIYKCHHMDASITRGLTSWMYSMLSQLVARWFAAESDARTDAEKATNRVAESLVRKVIELNRAQACRLLCQVHNVLEMSVRTATGVTEVNALLDVHSYLKHLEVVSRQADMAEDVSISAVLVAKSYIEFWKRFHPSAITMALLGGIRQSIVSLTSDRRELSQNMQRSLMEIYFVFAQATIEQRQRHWDDFIEPTSSFSLDMIVSQSYMQKMKTIFFHFIVEKEKEQYFLEFRSLVLNHWLLVLFQQDEDNFAEILTMTLLKNETESLAMQQLSSVLVNLSNSVQPSSIQHSLSEICYHTVAHVIPYLYDQQHNPEGEWLVGGLEDADCVSLLRTIFSTMKEKWLSLNERPEEQDSYTILIHSALDQYEMYPRSDFKIEPWFFNSATFPQRRKHTLAKILQKHDLKTDSFVEAREVFQQEISHAQRFDRFTYLENDMKEMLIPQPREDIPLTKNEETVWTVHSAFICESFPVIINSSDPNISPARTMILNILVEILSNLECRLSNFDLGPMESFITAMITIVNAFANTMHHWNSDNQSKAFTITATTFDWSICVLNDLSESFMDDVATICDAAGDDNSEEALMLLQTVMTRR